MSLDFKGKSDLIFLLGESKNDINCSEYLASYHKFTKSTTPSFDIDFELHLQEVTKKLIKNHLIESAHDVADGGLFITLLESSMPKQLGFDITTSAEIREDAFLFGESPSRIVVSVQETLEDQFIDEMKKSELPFTLLGHVTKGEIRIDELSYGHVSEFKDLYDHALSRHLTK